MPEGTVAPEVEKEGQEFKADKTGDGAWAERAPAQRAVERKAADPEGGEGRAPENAPAGETPPTVSFLKEFMLSKRIEEEIRQEAEKAAAKEAERQIEVRSYWRGVEGDPVSIDKIYTPGGEIVHLKFKDMPGAGKMLYLELPGYRPTYLVEETEEDKALIRILMKEEIEEGSGKTPEDMRNYLTKDTIEKLGLSTPKAQELARAA